MRLKNKKEDKVKLAGKILAKRLLVHFESHLILGPQAPIVVRVSDYFLQDIILKLRRGNSRDLSHQKNRLLKEIEDFKRLEGFKNTDVVVNVDC